MGYLTPVFGSHLYGAFTLRGTRYYVTPQDFTTPYGIKLMFLSPTGEYVGEINSTPDGSGFINFKITEDRIGGLKKFSFEIARNPDFPFYNLLQVQFFVQGIHWYTGELIYKPELDKRVETYEYEGQGFINYLKDYKIDVVYENKTLEEIIIDLITVQMPSEFPIGYNPSRILVPNLTITKIEFNKKTIYKALETLLEYANYDYNNAQFTFGIDKEKIFYFEEISQTVDWGFFEGFHYQEPDVEVSISDVVNKINIYRALEDSQDVEFVDVIEDLESQAKWGLKESDVQLSDYVDNATGIKIAQAKLERFKDIVKKIELENLDIDENPYPIGFYNVNNRQNTYQNLINECEDVNEWTKSGTHFTWIDQDDKVFSGKRAFYIKLATYAVGEYIEFELDEAINFPSLFNLYVAQEQKGRAFNFVFYDEDGNYLDLQTNYLGTEDGKILATEDGKKIALEVATIGLEINLIDDFQKLTFDISELKNIKKVQVVFSSNDPFVIYLDRLEIMTSSYYQNTLILDQITYEQDGSKILASPKFGERIETLVDNIKKLGEKQQGIINIFQKQ